MMHTKHNYTEEELDRFIAKKGKQIMENLERLNIRLLFSLAFGLLIFIIGIIRIIHDRDLNAAMNILTKGLELIA